MMEQRRDPTLRSCHVTDTERYEEIIDVYNSNRVASRAQSRCRSAASVSSYGSKLSFYNTNTARKGEETAYPNTGMELCERRVLRRKRPLIAEKLGFSTEDQKRYRQNGMLNDKIIGEIMVEQTEFSQTLKFLELLPDQGSTMFQVLLQVLTEAGHTWVAQEMRVDLLAEKGQLQIEEYVFRESGVIVHRQFGGSKRISETDKKEMQLVLALRYQAAKDAWLEQMTRVQQELAEALSYKCQQNGRLKAMHDKIVAYLTVQQKRINEYAHDFFNGLDLTRNDLDPESDERDFREILHQDIDNVLEVLSRILLEKENLADERNRCMQVLKITQPTLQLDLALEDALLQAADNIVKSKTKASLSDSMAQSMDAQMKAMRMETDREVAGQQRKIMHLESVLKQKDSGLEQLEKMVAESRQSQAAAEEELAKWKKRCQMLEKSRRLGYYNPGWFDRLYHMKDIEYGRIEDDGGPPPLVSLIPGVRVPTGGSRGQRDGAHSALTAKQATSPRILGSARNGKSIQMRVSCSPQAAGENSAGKQKSAARPSKRAMIIYHSGSNV